MDKLYSVARRMWYEEYFTQDVAEAIYPLLRQHRMHSDEPWYTTLPNDSEIYKNLFEGEDKEDYRWILKPGNNVMIFNKLVKDKMDGVSLDWVMFKKLVILASRRKNNVETEDDARTCAIDIIEAVHPSGIQDILNKQKL